MRTHRQSMGWFHRVAFHFANMYALVNHIQLFICLLDECLMRLRDGVDVVAVIGVN